MERTFLQRLVKLDETIDALRGQTGAVTSDVLNKQVKQFVEMADDLSFGRENTFFAVFDRLVMEGSGGKTPRNSALVLEITPPGGEKVTKMLTALKPAAAVPLANPPPSRPAAWRGKYAGLAGMGRRRRRCARPDVRFE